MKSVDTNILARALMRDDPVQTAMADELLQQGAFISMTVLLEVAWLLGSRYGRDREALADILVHILDLPAVVVEDGAAVRWAIERFRDGADIADAFHIAASMQTDGFVTFDRGMNRCRTDSSISIEIVP